MTKFVNPGDSVEGNKSDIIIRWISKPTLIDIEGVGRFYKYKSKKRAIIKITEELLPKVHRISPHSKLNLHDELNADVIEILTEYRIKKILISNFSSVHGIQCNTVSTFTYAKIIMPWRFVLERGIGGNQNAIAN